MRKKNVTIDFSNAGIINHTIQEKLEGLVHKYGFKITGLEKLKTVSNHEHGFRKLSH